MAQGLGFAAQTGVRYNPPHGTDDVRRIAFVTRRFGELQGLVTAAAGAAFVVGGVFAHYVGAPWVTGPWSVFFGYAATWAFIPYFTQAYRESYGSVAPRRRIERMPLVLLVLQTGVLADFLVAGHRGPSLCAVGVVLYAAFVLVRDVPWRVHYMVPLAAGSLAIALSISVPPATPQLQWLEPFDAARGPSYLLAYILIGFGVLVAGAFDHWLLIDALTPARLNPPPLPTPRALDDPRNRAANGGLRAVLACSAAIGFGLPVAYLGSPMRAALLMAVAVLPITLVVSLAISIDTYKGKMRERPSRSLASMIGGNDVIALVVLATTAVLDIFVGPLRVSLLALAVAAACLYVVVRDWPLRPYYLLGCVTALFSAFQYPVIATNDGAVRWLSTFAFLASASLTVESVLDCWMSRRWRAAREGAHADTV